jgi:hypothetical protein
MTDRVDSYGRAYAGSQLQIQTYVNLHLDILDAAILRALPELAGTGLGLHWVSPLEKDRFLEYRDEEFLSVAGYSSLVGLLAGFWPRGGPQWDAVARLRAPGASDPAGIVLIEAKSYPAEMYSSGCRAEGSARRMIEKSLGAAREWYGIGDGDWTGPLYQFANRLAYLYFFRKLARVPAWFVNVCFLDDPHKPTSQGAWTAGLDVARRSLGFPTDSIPYVADVFLPARGRELRERPPAEGQFQPRVKILVGQPTAGVGREWRFLQDERTGKAQFLALADWRGSSSLRVFDALSGVLVGEPRRARGLPYRVAFASIISSSKPAVGPPAVDFQQIPTDDLASMQRHVGLDVTTSTHSEPPPRRSSILAGVDEFVDQILGVTDIGRTAPHYKHLTSHARVAGMKAIDGEALMTGMYKRVEANWPGTPCRSRENWRFVRQPTISDRNESPEKRFEKTLVMERPEWVNMIPVASGLLPDVEEGGRRIDLARRTGPGSFELIELKIGPNCDTPLRAAIEILGYGVIYLFSRVHARELGYDPENELLSASRISLKVLAPQESYGGGSLQDLEATVNLGLCRLGASLRLGGLTINFSFESFPPGVSWPPGAAMVRRCRVYSSPA